MRSVRIEEVNKKTGKVRRGQTLYTSKNDAELRAWYYQPKEGLEIRIREV